MSHWSSRCPSWALLLAALTASCLGGQTGQPTAGHCQSKAQAADAEWGGLTVEQLARAFAGTHTAPLYWIEEPIGSTTHTPVAFDDMLTLRVRYEGAPGELVDCDSRLEVPVALELATSNSELTDQGAAVLVFGDTQQPLRAFISFGGSVVAVSGTVSETAAGEPPEGTLQPHTGDAPGAWASFPAAPPLESQTESTNSGGDAGQ
jgi:hypothetical protein